MFNFQRVGAIIVGAGSSSRMGGVDKIFAGLAGKPLIAHTVAAFEASPLVERIVLVLSEGNLEAGQQLQTHEKWEKVLDIVPGGLHRQDSVKAGLERLQDCFWIMIQDGARPLVDAALIESGLSAAWETGAAIAAVPVADTIKESLDGEWVSLTPERKTLWAAQTPQVFRFDIIKRAYSLAGGDATDDAALVEAVGSRVRLFPGSYHNIKITTRVDLITAEAIIRSRRGLT
jgi:2-C-methyl-D-erythritol 4-phosphate cytidylyltransferase